MANSNPFVPPSAVDVDLSAVAWGANRTMSDFETGMWRMEEAQPQLRSPIVAVEVLDRAPDWDRLLDAVEWASHVVPRIRMRAVEPAMQLGNPVWSVDPEFDIGYHLRRVRLPAPADFDHALRMCRHLATEPFDKARPPWSALLIEGLDDGRAVFRGQDSPLHHRRHGRHPDDDAPAQQTPGPHSEQARPHTACS